MNDVTILESDMTFGPYEKENVFYIEKCNQYIKLQPHGIKTCEFILLRKNKIIIVEAKKSCPNYSNSDKTDFTKYVDDIVIKFRDTLSLITNIILENYKQTGLSPLILKSFRSRLMDKQICPVLVVKTAQPKWLVDYPDVFRQALKHEMKIWKMKDFYVVNESKAKEMQLIC